jgi:hypothetical protein
MLASRGRVNDFVNEVSSQLRIVDYYGQPEVGLDWLRDRDDVPIKLTALAANAHILVTDNIRDFPSGQVRNSILFQRSDAFVQRLFATHPEA